MGSAVITEFYGYSQDGYLQTMSNNSQGSNALKSVRILDALGRTVRSWDKQNNTQTDTSYDLDNRLLSQTFSDANHPENNGTTAYSYYNDTSDTASSATGTGQLAKTVFTPQNTNTTAAATTTYSYQYWDDAQQSLIKKTAGTTTGQTTFTYNKNGHLQSTYDQAAKLTTTYFDSATGLILKRERYQGTSKGATPVGSHFYYYADGRRIGDVSDDPSDNTRISYAEALARKTQKPVDPKTLYKTFKPVSSADFDQNFEPINESYPAQAASSYTVKGSQEDLQSIALALWGDRAMWYLIADANGLSTADGLKAGQVLVIPNKVTNIHNNAGTFRPYNAGEAIGKIDPTLPAAPPPPQQSGHHGCGAIGQIVLIAIAVVVTVYTAGAASGLASASVSTWSAGVAAVSGAAGAGGIASAAVGAAAGSIVSQGVGVATGMQDSFSWKQVALSALAGGATAGIGYAANNISALSQLQGSGAWAAAGRAGLSSAATQVLQGNWNWQGVLASSLGAGVGTAAGNQLAGTAFGQAGDGFGAKLAGGFAGAVAAQWAGPGGKANYLSVFASTLGSVIGNSLGDGDDASHVPTGGAGLHADSVTASAWGPQYSFDDPQQSPDYSLAGAAARLGTGSDVRDGSGSQGTAYTAQRGDSISHIVGSSSPQAIGAFMQINGLTSSSIRAGQTYIIPSDTSGDNTALGQAALDADNARLQAQAAQRQAVLRQVDTSGQGVFAAGNFAFDGGTSFSSEAAAQPSLFDENQTFIVGNGGAIQANLAYAGPNAAQVPMAVAATATSNAVGAFKDLVLTGAGELGAWGDRQGGSLGGAAYAAGGIVYMAGTALPNTAAEAAAMLAAGPVLSRATGAAVGYLNTLPVFGADLGQLGVRGLNALGAGIDDASYSLLQRQGLMLNAVEGGGVGNAGNAAVLQVRTAAEVNEAMVQAGNLGAWGGATVTTEVVPIGTRFNMVVSEGQAQALMAGKPAFGGWATPDAIPSQAFARDSLAILPKFKPDISFVAQVETIAPQTVNRGLVGPLGGYAGGANQIELVGGRNLMLVGKPQPLPLGPN